VIDPLRECAPYLEAAAAEGLRITQVTETHIHADFVSGARELVAATGARLLLSGEGGHDWQYGYAAADQATLLHEGDIIRVGNLQLDVMHTPGHTPEHLAFVVTDMPRGAGPMGILTGDFVFVGDVGRPDLLERAAGMAHTMEAGARTLFHSLARFRALPDHLQVWPGHGAGSACGKALGAVPSSTVGYEKLSNWGVAETDEARFVASVLEGQPEPPQYFAAMKRINRDGPPVVGQLAPLPAIAPPEASLRAPALWMIDLRPAAEAGTGLLPGALSIPFSKAFSTYVGSLVPYDVDLLLLAPAGQALHDSPPDVVHRAQHALSLIGMDRVVGWMDVDAAAAYWKAQGRTLTPIRTVSVATLATMTPDTLTVIDVRGASEWAAGHLPQARHIPLGALSEAVPTLPAGPLVVHCQSGARSAIAASVLSRLGRDDVASLAGGYVAWRSAQP
jgi:hydroxyacylglutathione hydrolase